MRAYRHLALLPVTPHNLSACMAAAGSRSPHPGLGLHMQQQLAAPPADPRQQHPHGWPQTWLPVPQWLRSCHLLPVPWQMRQPLLQRWGRGEAWALRCCEVPPGRSLLPPPPGLGWLQGLQVRGLAPWLPSMSQLEAAVVVAGEQPALPPRS